MRVRTIAVTAIFFAQSTLVIAQNPYREFVGGGMDPNQLTPVARGSEFPETSPPSNLRPRSMETTQFVPVAGQSSATDNRQETPGGFPPSSFDDRDPLLPLTNPRDALDAAPPQGFERGGNPLDADSMNRRGGDNREVPGNAAGPFRGQEWDRSANSPAVVDPLDPSAMGTRPTAALPQDPRGTAAGNPNLGNSNFGNANGGLNPGLDTTTLTNPIRSNSSPMVLLVLLASLSANVYLGWIAWDTYNRYQDLVGDIRMSRSRRERGPRGSERDYEESGEAVLA